jgi:tetratricopeptide (TPR) repeat protein
MRRINQNKNDLILEGLRLAQRGQYEDALKKLRASTRSNPDDANVYYGLGLTYLLIGDIKSAMREYEVLKTIDERYGKKLKSFISSSGKCGLKA